MGRLFEGQSLSTDERLEIPLQMLEVPVLLFWSICIVGLLLDQSDPGTCLMNSVEGIVQLKMKMCSFYSRSCMIFFLLLNNKLRYFEECW